MIETSQPTQCECHECTQARWNSSLGGQIARVMRRVETSAMDGLQFENNRLKKDRDALLDACKMALGAFERNDCIDWNVLAQAIAAAERENEKEKMNENL